MLIKKISSILLLLAFLGALALTLRPDLHVKSFEHSAHEEHDHEGHDHEGHHQEDTCAVCHVLGHFIFEDASVSRLDLAVPDFVQTTAQALPQAFFDQVPHALIPRAPPLV